MAKLILNGSTSGSITLESPAVSGTTTITLPATSGTTVLADSSTGGAYIPTGTTAQRPTSPVNGMTRYNTTTGQLEAYNTVGGWVNAGTAGNIYTVSYLVVAGGGGGGNYYGGGGGAGGYLTSTTSLTSGTTYSVTVGAGGAFAPSTGTGSSGSNLVVMVVMGLLHL